MTKLQFNFMLLLFLVLFYGTSFILISYAESAKERAARIILAMNEHITTRVARQELFRIGNLSLDEYLIVNWDRLEKAAREKKTFNPNHSPFSGNVVNAQSYSSDGNMGYVRRYIDDTDEPVFVPTPK